MNNENKLNKVVATLDEATNPGTGGYLMLADYGDGVRIAYRGKLAGLLSFSFQNDSLLHGEVERVIYWLNGSSNIANDNQINVTNNDTEHKL